MKFKVGDIIRFHGADTGSRFEVLATNKSMMSIKVLKSDVLKVDAIYKQEICGSFCLVSSKVAGHLLTKIFKS